jgi:catechol 2,3-dioxygenase-like lactoylglutathione lyase family enzyme
MAQDRAVPSGGAALRTVRLGCRDLDRSTDFYRGLLGFGADAGGPRAAEGSRVLTRGALRLELVAVGAAGDLDGWENDDLQQGIRHMGMKVADVDREIRRLVDAGVTVLSPPADVLGDVRIAFFLDPDGARLEFIEGNLAYQHVSSPRLAAAEALTRLSPEDGVRFDHVAVTVSDLPAALRFWRDRMGFEVIGEIRHRGDPRGFLMTYLQAGPAVLEVFSFDVPTSAQPPVGASRLGFRGIGLVSSHVAGPRRLTGPDGVPVMLEQPR